MRRRSDHSELKVRGDGVVRIGGSHCVRLLKADYLRGTFDLASGRIDVIVDTYPSAQSALAVTPVEGAASVVPAPDERVLSTTKPGQTNFPVNLDNPDLVAAINDNLNTLRADGTLESIAVEWGFSPTAVAVTEPNLL